MLFHVANEADGAPLVAGGVARGIQRIVLIEYHAVGCCFTFWRRRPVEAVSKNDRLPSPDTRNRQENSTMSLKAISSIRRGNVVGSIVCTHGSLLILAPWPEDMPTFTSDYDRFHYLNRLAETICAISHETNVAVKGLRPSYGG